MINQKWILENEKTFELKHIFAKYNGLIMN